MEMPRRVLIVDTGNRWIQQLAVHGDLCSIDNALEDAFDDYGINAAEKGIVDWRWSGTHTGYGFDGIVEPTEDLKKESLQGSTLTIAFVENVLIGDAVVVGVDCAND